MRAADHRRLGPPLSRAVQERRSRFVALWNDTSRDLSAIERNLAFPTRNAVRSYAGHLRALGYVLANRVQVAAAARRSRPSRMGRATEQVMAEDTILRSALIAPATVYDGEGRVIGTMSALTR